MASQITERITVDTSGSTLTLDLGQLHHRMFVGNASADGAKTIALKNDAFAERLIIDLAVPDEATQVDTVSITGTDGTAEITVAGGLTKTLTYGTAVAQVDTVTLTGTSGTANITVAGGLTKLATFDTDLTTTAANFVTAHAAAYLVVGIVLTSAADDLIFTAETAGTSFLNPVTVNLTGDLNGTEVATTANLTALADAAADFVTDFAADYAGQGITLTSSGERLIFTSDTAAVAFDSPVITNLTEDLAGTVENTTASSSDVLTLTLPTSFTFPTDDTRWTEATRVLILTGVGSYAITADFNGTTWKAKATADGEYL